MRALSTRYLIILLTLIGIPQIVLSQVSRIGLKKRISGTFIQYQSWMMKINQTKWNLELEAAKNSGIDTVIIQWLQSDQNRFFPGDGTENDPTEFILSYADQKGLKVFLGLQFEKSWWHDLGDPEKLSQLAKNSVEFGNVVLKRYQKHPSFVGWYIPYETSDLHMKDEEINRIHSFLARISTGLKSLSKRSYLISFSAFLL